MTLVWVACLRGLLFLMWVLAGAPEFTELKSAELVGLLPIIMVLLLISSPIIFLIIGVVKGSKAALIISSVALLVPLSLALTLLASMLSVKNNIAESPEIGAIAISVILIIGVSFYFIIFCFRHPFYNWK
jgi:hypothetical protein